MHHRIYRFIAGVFSVLLLASTSTHADPLTINDVIQSLNTYQSSAQLGLRDDLIATALRPDASILDGSLVNSEEPQNGVATVPQGDVEVTICDCGEILVASGGFPKWPLLFLAAVPLVWPHHDEPNIPVFPTPTPPGVVNPPQTPIPEPTSLLLLGSGLAVFGGVLRKRYAGMKLAARVDAREEANINEN